MTDRVQRGINGASIYAGSGHLSYVPLGMQRRDATRHIFLYESSSSIVQIPTFPANLAGALEHRYNNHV